MTFLAWARRVAAVAAIAAATASSAARSAEPDVAVGEWPTYRHDRCLTARAEGGGHLTSPEIVWKHDLRGHHWRIAIEPCAETTRLAINEEAAGRAAHAPPHDAGEFGPPLVDLAGDGVLRHAPPYAARLLPDVPGLQNFAVVMADSERGHGELYAYNGGRHRVWQSEEFDVFQGPHPVVADANGDGHLDVVVCPHYQVAVLDGRTGKTIEKLRWHNGRNYGTFVVKNIDSQPAQEMCVISDFYSHIDMIGNDGHALKLLWRKEIELKIESKAKIVRPRWDPLEDLDGDGRFEVIVNLYNDTGDKQWRLMVYDALTGQTRLDLPGASLEGLEDIDGDGCVELFCAKTSALFVPTSSELLLLNYRNGAATQRWSYPCGGWVTAQRPFPLYFNSTVAYADHNIVTPSFGRGEKGFLVQTPATDRQGASLRSFRITKSKQIEPVWICQAPRGTRRFAVPSARPLANGNTSIGVSFDTAQAADTITLEGARGTLLDHQRIVPEAAQAGNLIAARLASGPSCTLVSAAGNREVEAVDVRGSQPRALWRREGAGPLAACRPADNPQRQVAMLGWEPSGEGNVTVCGAGGRVVWKAPIGGFPGPLEPWNFGTLTYLAAGHFTDPRHDDLAVFARRSTMHSDEGFCLSGKDGKILWRRDHADDETTRWGFGGTPLVIADHDGDGLDDLWSLYPVNFTVVRGKDGRQLLGRSAARNVFAGIWAAYSLPMLFAFDGDRKRQVLWSSPYVLGMTDTAGAARWAAPQAADGFAIDWAGKGTYSVAALNDRGLNCYDPRDGRLQWQLPLEGMSGRHGAIVGHFCGRPGEEIVVAVGSQLRCLGMSDNRAAVLWSVRLPGEIREIIAADVVGSGSLQIVAQTQDGFLYGIDQPRREPQSKFPR